MELLIAFVICIGFALFYVGARKTEVPKEKEIVTARDAASAAKAGCSYLICILLLIIAFAFLLPALVPLPPH